MSVQILKIPFEGEFIKEGDTIGETVLDITDAGDLLTSNVKMQLYDKSRRVIDIGNGNGITVNTSTRLTIDEVPFSDNNLSEGVYVGDFEITDSSGIRKKYFNIEYTIVKGYTK